MTDEPDSLHQPNDKLFKQAFSDPATAAGFLAAYLPERIAALVDWSTLSVEAGSFIDSEFRQHESDLLFHALIAGHEVKLYCLFEHQTREDPAIALRLLRYMVRIWEAALKQSPEQPLPVIVPVVLAQSERAWRTRPTFSALFDLPESLAGDLRPFLPDFLFRLIELAEIPFEAIRGTPAGIMVLRTMKAERSQSLLSDPVWEESLLQQLPQEIFEILLRYIMNADVDSDAIEHQIKKIHSSKLQKTAMTLAQKLHKQGLSQGRLQALQGTVVEALEVRFGSVPEGLRETIQTTTEETKLHDLHRAAIRCATLDAFAAEL